MWGRTDLVGESHGAPSAIQVGFGPAGAGADEDVIVEDVFDAGSGTTGTCPPVVIIVLDELNVVVVLENVLLLRVDEVEVVKPLEVDDVSLPKTDERISPTKLSAIPVAAFAMV